MPRLTALRRALCVLCSAVAFTTLSAARRRLEPDTSGRYLHGTASAKDWFLLLPCHLVRAGTKSQNGQRVAHLAIKLSVRVLRMAPTASVHVPSASSLMLVLTATASVLPEPSSWLQQNGGSEQHGSDLLATCRTAQLLAA